MTKYIIQDAVTKTTYVQFDRFGDVLDTYASLEDATTFDSEPIARRAAMMADNATLGRVFTYRQA
ncbi:MAG: hypothetical protein E5W82_10620 [Mesorhizobium sp.]|nr:MAG: hypothetical protein E5W82_10620 [Mesorhizobium sp.]